MRSSIACLLGLTLTAPAWGQAGGGDAAAEESAAPAENVSLDDFDREPERCITANRIRQTKVIDKRTVVFYMNGNRVYRNELPYDCPRLAQEKRFSYDLRTNQLCNTDVITVLEYWGTQLQQGASCGLGLFYPITREEAELLDQDPDEMLENAQAVEETVESSGEAVTPAPDAADSDAE